MARQCSGRERNSSFVPSLPSPVGSHERREGDLRDVGFWKRGREVGREGEHDNGDYICWEFDSSLSFCHLSRRMRNGVGSLAPCFVRRDPDPKHSRWLSGFSAGRVDLLPLSSFLIFPSLVLSVLVLTVRNEIWLRSLLLHDPPAVIMIHPR